MIRVKRCEEDGGEACTAGEFDIGALESMLVSGTVLVCTELVPDMLPADGSSIQMAPANPQAQPKSVVLQPGSPPQSLPRSVL